MNLRRIFAVLIVIIGIYSCDQDDDSKTLEETEISYNIIQHGNFSSSQDDGLDAQYLVFKTENKWSEFYQQVIARRNQDQAENFSEIEFNFNTKTLILVTSGYDETCCKTIEINKVYEDQGRIYVTFEVGESDNSLEILSQSYLLLAVAKN
jgi:hypothetical protein